MPSLMTPRERFQAVMSFHRPDRLPIVEWAVWWNQTLARWHREGLPAHLQDRYAISDHFGLDPWLQDWISPRSPGCPRSRGEGRGLVEDEAGYERIRPWLYPDDGVDLDRWARWSERQRDGEAVLWFTFDGFFWFARSLLGIENHLLAFYDQPDLLHRINQDLADWMRRSLERLGQVAAPDFMTFAEDLSYNKGPMLSRDQFDSFLTPYYRQVVPCLDRMGTLPLVDSDGDVTSCLGWFRDAGIQGVLPLERQAGVDIGALRRAQPEMRFIGHFDKMTMTRGEAAMRTEFERLLPVARMGGFIPSVDHQTPPGVSLADYRLYLSLFREFAGAL